MVKKQPIGWRFFGAIVRGLVFLEPAYFLARGMVFHISDVVVAIRGFI
jgi:hypothetical protein